MVELKSWRAILEMLIRFEICYCYLTHTPHSISRIVTSQLTDYLIMFENQNIERSYSTLVRIIIK
jgi:hypothetical protein